MVDENVVSQNTTASVKVLPTGVKVIGVLEYIGAGLSLIFGLLFLFGAGFISAIGATLVDNPLFATFGSAIFVILGILMLGSAVLSFFIARGLFKLQKWARIIVIVFSCLGVLFGLLSIFGGTIGQGIFGMIVNGLIGGYLSFSKEVQAAFA